MNRSAREGKSVKRFERSNGPDIALYKNYLYLFYLFHGIHQMIYLFVTEKSVLHINILVIFQ